MTTAIGTKKVLVVPDLGHCYEWSGSRTGDGYGRRGYRGRVWLAHRAAWDEQVGSIPTGRLVLHRCDNRPCVRVAHLYLGDYHDNMRDMVERGRCDNAGESNGRSVLSADDVLRIRNLYTGTKRSNPAFVSQKQLAAMFGVDQTTISRIVLRKSWESI